LNEAPNEEWSSFLWRSYFWQQVFTHGRGLSYIERATSGAPQAIWPMDACRAQVRRENGRKLYVLDGKVYAAADIIDVPFMLKDDQLQARSPLVMGGKAISLAIAMGDYASNFFAGDGIPPLALTGALPTGPDGFRRAVDDIKRAMEVAKDGRRGYFPIPPGYKLEPVGFDPAKGQMVEARLFQIQEIARVYQLPPAFLQDLSKGTFSNTEQQDLQVTKHCIAQWSKALEDELNLKLFGATRNSRYAEHSMDGLLRGDLAARMTALSQAINSALLMPDEARALDNRPAAEGGNRLYIQGATVPLAQSGGQAPATPNPPPADPAPASNGAAA
jgi:HK97 family phage portal protein